MAHYLHFDGIAKQFPGVRALDAVTFGAAEGSVHALLGENGAGKSTLLKILGGAYRPDGGRVLLGGAPQAFASTADAFAAGVAVIHQELHLVPEMTVAENVLLGHLPHWGGWVDRRRLVDETARLLEVMGEAIHPDARVSSLPMAQRQMVEIAKALSRDAKVLAFDEPTSSLSDREVHKLFAIIRELKAQGRVVLYVSHRLEEIFEIADAATVLRDGRHVETFGRLDGVDRDVLINRMVGRSIADIYRYAPRPHGRPALEVFGLSGPGLAAPTTLEVSQGEIAGVFGLVGAGRTELLKLIYGAERAAAGHVSVAGRELRGHTPAASIAAGMVFCPEDRKKEGIVPTASVAENVNLSARRNTAALGFILNGRWERENVRRQIERLGIRTPSPEQRIANLSGGNQQKAILARWLSENVNVLLLDEPTRGIDIGAKSEIYSLIYELAERGVGVLMVSSELPEVMGVCDRILVMRQGRLVASVPRDEADQERLLALALPATEEVPA